MIVLLTQVDWANIKDILGGAAAFVVLMFFLWLMFRNL